MSDFLEIETKYDATEIRRVEFKKLVATFGHHIFRYAESRDIYYTKSGDAFLRYRMPSYNEQKSELTFKVKHAEGNNNVRTEVNLRVDQSNSDTVKAFCEGIGYSFNFTIMKFCDIYDFNDANLAYYTVIDEAGKSASFIEIEANETRFHHDLKMQVRTTKEEGWAIVQNYEKALAPLGITAQKRMKLSLFERYRKATNG